MAYTPVIVEEFPGLDARLDVPTGAVDLWNVDRESPAALRTRYGTTTLRDSGSTAYELIHAHSSGQLLVQRGGTLEAIFTFDGSVIASVATSDQSGPIASMITDTATLSFYYDSGSSSLRQWNGTAFSTPAWTGVTPAGEIMGVTPYDNRLVTNADPISNPNRLYFSDPGNPAAFLSSNWLVLPGTVIGICSWNGQMYVLLDRGCAAFYSTTVDRAGEPIFNFRYFELPCRPAADAGIVAGADGVYFVATDGIYRIRGVNDVAKVSVPIDPIFGIGSTISTVPLVSPLVGAVKRPVAAGDRIYFPLQTEDLTLFLAVFNVRDSAWFMYSTPAVMLATTGTTVYFVDQTSAVKYFDSTSDDDTGTPIVSYYQAPFRTMASGDSARFRRFALTGSGVVSHSTASDDAAMGTGATVTMGTAPAISRAYDTRAARGRDLSFKVSAASGAWTLQRWQTWIADVRRRG